MRFAQLKLEFLTPLHPSNVIELHANIGTSSETERHEKRRAREKKKNERYFANEMHLFVVERVEKKKHGTRT